MRNHCSFRFTMWLVLLLGLAVYGRGSLHAADEAEKAPPENPPASADAPEPDHSLTGDAYVEAGVPAYDRAWSGIDMAKAVEALSKIDAEEVCQLPRLNSPKSGKVFAKLIDRDDFKSLTNPDVPLNLRLGDGSQRMLASSKLLSLYLTRQTKGDVTDVEIVEVTAGVVGAASAFARCVNEIPELAETDPQYAARKKGRDQWQGGNTQILSGILQMLTEEKNYSIAARQRLLFLCEDPFLALYANTTPVGRKELATKLKTLSGDEKYAALQPRLSKLSDRVRRLLENE